MIFTYAWVAWIGFIFVAGSFVFVMEQGKDGVITSTLLLSSRHMRFLYVFYLLSAGITALTAGILILSPWSTQSMTETKVRFDEERRTVGLPKLTT